jgi:hypothetical protein
LALAMLSLLCAFSVAQAPAQPAAGKRIVAIGDIHGDYAAWSTVIRAAGLVDARGRWSGGRTVLVQTGDVPDRGPDTLKILRQLMTLQRDAAKQGGRVIALVGNHEAMNMTGDLRYVDPGEYAAFADSGSAARRESAYPSLKSAVEAKYRAADPTLTDSAIKRRWIADTPLGWVEHRLAWRPSGEVGKWIVRNPAVAIVDGNIFVHGGISAEYSRFPVAELNRRVRSELMAGDAAPTAAINDPLGPLWYRGLVVREAGEARPPIDQELRTVLDAYSARRIVVGHTPLLSGIAVLHGGKLARIDSGMSRYYHGQYSYLEIIGDRLIPHVVPHGG